MGGHHGFATDSHPCIRNLNEMLKHLPYLMEKQLRRIEEILSAVATSPNSGTIVRTYTYISSFEICENLLELGRVGSSPKSYSSPE